ncbi:MAG TPA: rhomboid family intramembrane serine protease [Streptosporangiaceae bacterium]|nr:rhomboid family intramembrane serine protease [Streptosporangiaceae bacterium]
MDPRPAPEGGSEADAPTPAPGNGGEAAVPTCFRHPGRETYLSCVRCGRPACPECLRSAPVGQQCVECIREGNRGTRTPAGVFGGRAVSGALVTYTLIGLNVAFYLVEWVYPRIVDYFDMIGAARDPALHYQLIGVATGQEYRLLTSAFLHEPGLSGFGPAHIIFNMWALLLVGPGLERLLGRLRFLAVYLLSALGGSVLFYVLAPPNQQALGASGAVFGLFGAWFVVSKRLQVDSRAIVFLIVLNLVISFVVAGIAWQDHVGGLVTGGLLTAAYAYAPRQHRALIQAGATLAVVVLLVVAVVVRNGQLMA